MRKAIDFFRMHFLLTDTIVTIVIFYIIRAICNKSFEYCIEKLILENAEILYPIFFNTGLTLVGFLLTGISITITFLQADKLDKLRKTNHPKAITGIYFNAIKVGCVFCAISFAGLVYSNNYIVAHLTEIIVLVFIIRFWRCVWVIEQVSCIIFRQG